MSNDQTPSDNSSGGSSNDAALEQVRQQVEEYKNKYEALQSKVTDGKLVDPTAFLEKKVKDGEVFPKDRFVGLQQTFQTAQQTLTELQSKVTGYETKISKLEETLGTKGTELGAKDVELGTLRRDQARAKLIFSKFPELASFEADGLLPQAEESEMEAIFTAFSSKLGAVKNDAAAAFAGGGTGPTPPKREEAKAQTAKTHLGLANDALAKGDFTTYNQEYDKYLEALNAQS
jgi:chromosome segregation ATPase